MLNTMIAPASPGFHQDSSMRLYRCLHHIRFLVQQIPALGLRVLANIFWCEKKSGALPWRPTVSLVYSNTAVV